MKDLSANLILLGGLLGGLLAGGCGPRESAGDGRWVSVLTDTSPGTLNEIGTLEPKELARIQTLISGTVSEVVDDATRVEPGDFILKLDDEELRSNLENELANLDQIREDLENEIAEMGVLTNSFQITSRLKQAELEHARLELETRLVSLLPGEKRLREIEIELAELDLEDKKSQLERERELVRNQFAPASSLKRAQREMEAAVTFLEEKRSQLELDSLPLPEEERLTLETAVKNAEDAVRRNQEKQNRDVHLLNLKIEGVRLKIEHARENIATLREQLENVVLTAPTGGILRLTQNWVWSVRNWMPISTGQRVRDLEIVGSVVDPNDLTLRIIVHESDFPLVKPGQRVRARLTGFPEEELGGQVKKITELGQDRNDLSPIYRQAPAIHQAMFLVTVELEELGEKVIPGMTAMARIEIEPPRARLLIPRRALREREGDLWVRRRRSGEAEEEVRVQGRIDSEGRFEVVRGLEPGDEIWLPEGS